MSLKGEAGARHRCVFPRAIISCPLGSKNMSAHMKEGAPGSTTGGYYAEFGRRRLCSGSWLQQQAQLCEVISLVYPDPDQKNGHSTR